MLQTRDDEDDGDVIDLTYSPPKQKKPVAQSSDAHCYICLGNARNPVTCMECNNVMGCLTHMLELSNYDKRCPICKEDSVVKSCIDVTKTL